MKPISKNLNLGFWDRFKISSLLILVKILSLVMDIFTLLILFVLWIPMLVSKKYFNIYYLKFKI